MMYSDFKSLLEAYYECEVVLYQQLTPTNWSVVYTDGKSTWDGEVSLEEILGFIWSNK